ncbi:hypothetical protein GGX14DRAFT_652976 [Mycena pura]|uniref:Uncharacterized protein n=1 Tax=Mycena pura TaxID=153505 RepID=A0AAD6V8K6_9AGAR|nr:hypothetical protein GGX14DRAFT_652976 [Mycena pura]
MDQDFSVTKARCDVRLSPLPWNQMTALDEDGQSIVSSDSDVTRGIREALEIVSSNGCYVFGVHVRVDEAAHVIESWRKDEDRKEKTEYTLRQLGIVSLDFHLDHPSNLHWLNAIWHKALDKYGVWSWAPSRDSLEILYGILLKEREARQYHYEQTGEALWRQWDESSFAFATIRYDILIFNYSGMLVLDQPIVRREGGVFKVFYPDVDGHLHLTTGQMLEPFRVPRSEGSELNPFLVALSCLNKLTHHMEARRTQELPGTSPHREYLVSLTRLVDEIWKPLEPSSSTVRASPLRRTPRTVQLKNLNWWQDAEGDGAQDTGGGSGGTDVQGSFAHLPGQGGNLNLNMQGVSPPSEVDPFASNRATRIASNSAIKGGNQRFSPPEEDPFSSNRATRITSTSALVLHDQEEDPEVASQQGQTSGNQEEDSPASNRLQEHADFLDSLSLPEKISALFLYCKLAARFTVLAPTPIPRWCPGSPRPADSGRIFFRPHPRLLIAATARQVADWAVENDQRCYELEEAIQGGVDKLLELSVAVRRLHTFKYYTTIPKPHSCRGHLWRARPPLSRARLSAAP